MPLRSASAVWRTYPAEVPDFCFVPQPHTPFSLFEQPASRSATAQCILARCYALLPMRCCASVPVPPGQLLTRFAPPSPDEGQSQLVALGRRQGNVCFKTDEGPLPSNS